MAIDPRISLAVQQANVSPAIDLFQRTLQQTRQNNIQDALLPGQLQLQQQAIQQGEQAQQAAGINLQSAQDRQDLSSLAQFSTLNKDAFNSAVGGDIEPLRTALVGRMQELQSQGRNTQQTSEAIDRLNQGDAQGVIRSFLSAEKLAGQSGLLGQKQVATKAFAPVTDPSTGQVSIPTFDPNTGQATLQPIEGLIQETPGQKREAELLTSTTKKASELKAKRTSDITKELGERNRSAARAQRPLKQALKLVAKAEQGLTGAAKLQLSRLLPGVDASDEAALSATLNQLALEQLQQFKGPTTDFEFGITQNIAGTLGQSREANEARVKSLDRNNWFNQREFKQFQQHIKSGGDPDSFAFNFGEPVKTKKGVFTLQDIQDTAVNFNLTIEETLKRLNQ